MTADYLDGELVMPDAGPAPARIDAGGPAEVARADDVRPLHLEIRLRWLLAQDSPNTRAAYARDLDAFLAWCDEWGFPPLALSRTHADAYREYLAGQYRSHATRARKMSAVSSFFRFAMQDSPELVVANPMTAAKRPKVDKDTQTVGLELDQAQRLLDVAAEMGTWENLAVRVLLHTGIRVSELAEADTRDMRKEGKYTTLRVVRKGGTEARVVLADEAVDAITAHLRGRSGPLLRRRDDLTGRRTNRQEIARVIAKVGERAGIPNLHPHMLRHSAATIAILYGGEDGRGAPVHDVQEMLGHSSIATTMRYVHAAGRNERSAVHGLASALRRRDPSGPDGMVDR